MAGSENYNLVMLARLLEAFISKWTHINACLDSLAGGEGDRDGMVVRRVVNIIDAVHQSFIQIEYQSFLVLGERKLN